MKWKTRETAGKKFFALDAEESGTEWFWAGNAAAPNPSSRLMAETRPQPCIPLLIALADETRWRLVRELLARPLTVTQLTARLDVSQYNVSKHLRILQQAGIVPIGLI